jgi:hypothetical protein
LDLSQSPSPKKKGVYLTELVAGESSSMLMRNASTDFELSKSTLKPVPRKPAHSMSQSIYKRSPTQSELPPLQKLNDQQSEYESDLKLRCFSHIKPKKVAKMDPLAASATHHKYL